MSKGNVSLFQMQADYESHMDVLSNNTTEQCYQVSMLQNERKVMKLNAHMQDKKIKYMEAENSKDHTEAEKIHVLRSLYFTPILFAILGDRTPNLTTITVTTNHYTPYSMQRHWSRLSHSLMAVRLMFTL